VNMSSSIKNIVLFMLLTITTVYSQQHDNVWTFGYTCVPGDSSRFGGTNLYFGDGVIESEYHCRDIRFLSNLTSSISDAEGNLMLMFNGCTLNDANNEIVEGNDILGRNDTNIEQTWWCDDGYNTPHGAMFLPDPYDEDQYYLFFRDVIDYEEKPYVISDSLYAARIVFEGDYPHVLEKKSVIQDTISRSGTAVVRHANGKDWWLIYKDQFENIYYKVLLDKSGPHHHSTQKINNKLNTLNGGATKKMSPNGQYLVTFDPYNDLEIFTFDRFTGELSQHIEMESWLDAQANVVVDIEFSPSGEFLYVADTDTLWQFDMTVESEDFFASKEIVGIYDGFTDPFPTNFWLMQKAPDGKIYMSQRNGSQYLHVIHNPDERGLDCDFRQHDYKLPTVNAFAMPYFPNFRLGADSTWVATQDLEEVEILISPNPVRDRFIVRADIEVANIVLYDVTGNLVLSSKDLQVVVDGLATGIYFCKVYASKGRLLATEKVVVY